MPTRSTSPARLGTALAAVALAVLALALTQVGPVVGQDVSPARRRPAEVERGFTKTFYLDQCEWASTGGNLFFRLEPGLQHVLQGREERKTVEAVITVLDETETVGEVETRIVEERESVDGKLVEVSRNFFANCGPHNSVIYFGEDVDNYENGRIINHNGSWRAGVNGARPGLMMPGLPLLGARYYQEIAPGVALDRAEIVEVSAVQRTPLRTFRDALVTEESTPLEPGVRETKAYAPGVGQIRDADLLLVRFGFNVN